MATKTVKAKKVREGDFLPGLDNGYVFEVEKAADYDLHVVIWYHDVNGDENYITTWPDNQITIRRD
jgi:hypothetical protein